MQRSASLRRCAGTTNNRIGWHRVLLSQPQTTLYHNGNCTFLDGHSSDIRVVPFQMGRHPLSHDKKTLTDNIMTINLENGALQAAISLISGSSYLLEVRNVVFAEWFARPYVALCFLALGMAVIPLNDLHIKLLGETMPLGQIVAIRSLMSLAFIALFSSGLRQMTGLSSSVFWQFVGRGMCLVLAMVLFAPLGSLSLASAVSIFFTAPLLITLLSVPLLGEKIEHPPYAVSDCWHGWMFADHPTGDC